MSDTPVTRKLTDNEITVLAYRLCERELATEWFEWEDIPMLGEYDFERLTEKMDTVLSYLWGVRRQMETTWGIDSSALLEELS